MFALPTLCMLRPPHLDASEVALTAFEGNFSPTKPAANDLKTSWNSLYYDMDDPRDCAIYTGEEADAPLHLKNILAYRKKRANILTIGPLEDSLKPLRQVQEIRQTRRFSRQLVDWPMEELEIDLRIKVTGCYAVVQWAIPKLLAVKNTHKPTSLCTSGSIYKDPLPEAFSLAACKAAQHNLVHSMHKKYKEEGVDCGLVTVRDVVADENPQCNAENIVNKTWSLYEQGNDLEVEIVDD